MVGYYIRLRLKQFWRFFAFNDINPFFGLVSGTLLFIVVSALFFHKIPYAAWAFAGLWLMMIVQNQSNMRDRYLASLFQQKQLYTLRLAENILISLPAAMVLIYYKAWLPLAVLAATIFILPVFNFSLPKLKRSALKPPFLKHSFEFNSGYRTYFLVFPLYPALLLIGIISGNVYVYIIPFVIMLFFAVTFYGLPEDITYIWLYRTTAKAFLIKKLKTAATNYTRLFALFVVLGLIFYPVQWPYFVVCFLCGLLVMTGTVFIKYLFFPNAFITQVSQLFFFGMVVLCVINPVFLLLALLMLFYLWLKSIKKLKTILKC